ncbi:predicted protein [Arabidopsis lyrata subsp. lyrata]|uniref:Predicted protein n=1 Tax=Arabidopsis lyrata subsp. lyrata TaxID=81972 RepID=D7MK70_ARALL|nr:predicted protein [Arabidopsis lyrata subsp. lyrata]
MKSSNPVDHRWQSGRSLKPFFAIRNGRLLLRYQQATNLLLSLSEKNPGKLYYKCHPCGFFKWWHRSLQTRVKVRYDKDRVLNEGASSSASTSASASSSSTSSLSLLGEVFCSVGEMMKRLSLEQEQS